jgi:hypothetical protein
MQLFDMFIFAKGMEKENSEAKRNARRIKHGRR